MTYNPWQVHSIQDFSFLNCPECSFKSKEENFFQHHAMQNHPLSFVLFELDDVKVKVEEENSAVTSEEQNKRHDKFESYIGVKLEEDESLHYEDNNIDPMRHCTISFDENEEGEVIPKIIKKKTVKSNSSLTSLKKKKKRKILFDDYDDHKDDSIENSNTILDESSIEKIKCYYCEEYFTKQKMLKEHAQIHSIDGNFSCKDCDKKLPTYKKLIHHNLNQHTSYTCAKCQKVLPGKQVYDNHKKACHVDKSIKMFKCDQCPHATHAKEYLNNHKKRMHAKGEFVCQECKKAFTKEGLLINHVCGSENDHFKCPKCEFEHTQKYFMTHYKKVHGGIPPGFDHETKFICDQCSSEFLSAKYLAQHIALTHTTKKVLAESTEKYQCEQCETDFDYKNENLMMKHYFEVHGTIPQKFENIPKYFCDHCPKLLTSEQALKSHVKYNHSTGPKKLKIKNKILIQCPHCEKKYPGKDRLREHVIMKHEKSAKFQCDTCHRKFPTSAKLRSHVKMEHTKVTCDVCENAFNRIDLKKHRATIHGILPHDAFKCQFCPMFFKFEKNLKRHAESKHA